MDNSNDKKAVAMESISLDFSAAVHKPTFKEDKKAGIYKYGEDNLYTDILLDAYINKSNKHNSIIKKKLNMSCGEGFEEVTGTESRKFMLNFNGSHEMNDLAWLLMEDLWVFNAFAYLVRWNDEKTKVAAIDYVPVHKVRKGLADDTWFISDNWAHPKKKESNTRMYNSLNSRKVREGASEEERRLSLVQLVYVKTSGIGSDSYPHVSYQSAMNYIMADYEIGRFTYNNLCNNFTGGYHVAFRGVIPEESERKAVKKQFKNEYTGSNSESIIFTWNEEEGGATEIKGLPTSGNENAWLAVEEQVQTNIFIAHSVTNPMLFGIREAGSLGGKEELVESLEIFNKTEIAPMQRLLERSLNRTASMNEVEDKFKLKEYKLDNID